MTAYDSDAAVVLAWLLLPGATRIAAELSDLHPDIDGLVAGQLWIEVSGAHRLRTRRVAATILARTRREVCAELGVGDLARRRDRVWVDAVRIENGDDLGAPDDGHESLDDLFDQITELMIDAMGANAIDAFDAWLIGALASLAAQMGVAGSSRSDGSHDASCRRSARRPRPSVAASDQASRDDGARPPRGVCGGPGEPRAIQRCGGPSTPAARSLPPRRCSSS